MNGEGFKEFSLLTPSNQVRGQSDVVGSYLFFMNTTRLFTLSSVLIGRSPPHPTIAMLFVTPRPCKYFRTDSALLNDNNLLDWGEPLVSVWTSIVIDIWGLSFNTSAKLLSEEAPLGSSFNRAELLAKLIQGISLGRGCASWLATLRGGDVTSSVNTEATSESWVEFGMDSTSAMAKPQLKHNMEPIKM
ncbi:hypothetical protein TI04_11705 [Achromatium sp. WMS2]|nr:hypothetical protein TI04_11705 [Achromatium sp. WMS2]